MSVLRRLCCRAFERLTAHMSLASAHTSPADSVAGFASARRSCRRSDAFPDFTPDTRSDAIPDAITYRHADCCAHAQFVPVC
jgi:hypothetical protein